MGTVAANLGIILRSSKYFCNYFVFTHTLSVHLNSINLKYINISKLQDFDFVQQLHSTSAFVDMIFNYPNSG